MSSIIIHDLAHSATMDAGAMSAVRGGGAFGPDVNVNVALTQQIGQFQQIGVNVLNNNGVIGAALPMADVNFAAAQWSENHATLPRL